MTRLTLSLAGSLLFMLLLALWILGGPVGVGY